MVEFGTFALIWSGRCLFSITPDFEAKKYSPFSISQNKKIKRIIGYDWSGRCLLMFVVVVVVYWWRGRLYGLKQSHVWLFVFVCVCVSAAGFHFCYASRRLNTQTDVWCKVHALLWATLYSFCDSVLNSVQRAGARVKSSSPTAWFSTYFHNFLWNKKHLLPIWTTGMWATCAQVAARSFQKPLFWRHNGFESGIFVFLIPHNRNVRRAVRCGQKRHSIEYESYICL